MSKKYRVTNSLGYERFGLKVGDIVTKVDDSADDLYELPEHLHGQGHTGVFRDEHLNLQEYNYIYLSEDDLEEIEENRK